MRKIYILTGQTATGKTRKALEIASKHQAVLINADSRQIYKYIDITTGKDLPPNAEFHLQEKKGDFQIGYYLFGSIPIYLYDIIRPDQYFSSYDWAELAFDLSKRFLDQGRVVVIVGGSFFYIKNLLFELESKNIPADENLRRELSQKSISQLQEILYNLRPDLLSSLNASDRQNPYRLIRRIELAKANPSISFGKQGFEKQTLSTRLSCQLEMKAVFFRSRDDLEKTIKKRVEQRIENQAIQEVEKLLEKGLSPADQGLKTIGVRQILQYLKKEISFDQMLKDWVANEIKYAKRQRNFIEKTFDQLKNCSLEKIYI